MDDITWDDEVQWDQPGQQAPTQQQAPVSGPELSTFDRIKRGMVDPIDAGAQMLTHALPQGVVDAGNQFNNWLADKGLPLDRIPERNITSLVTGQPSGLDALLQQQEQQYQAQRSAQGQDGIDWARLGGNVLSPANLALASKIPVAASMAGRVAIGAATGAGFGMLQPVTSGDFATEKAKQAGIGAITGGILPMVTGAAARIIRPNTNKAVDTLAAEGVKPTIGQQLGGTAKAIEEKLSSVPFVGDAIKTGQKGAIEQFNTAAINRSLTPIGEKLPKGVTSGHEAIQFAIDKLDDAYNTILPKLSGKIDGRMIADVNKIKSMVQSLPEAQRQQFDDIVKTELFGRFTGSGLASGESIKVAESQLGNFSRGLGRSQDYNASKLGEAIGEVQRSLRTMLTRQNPSEAGNLAKINKGYANLLRVQRAASALGAQDGAFTPAQLANISAALTQRIKYPIAFAGRLKAGTRRDRNI